ncbi:MULTISPECIES: hypothetical protein [unclassified Leucobacter]|uniref:hypothetical protein n=1 Tax=unclassified Leucobacter TaxID=2621730 RepID=UPI0006227A78|nr:hypothetical protein [Leucobacter sp. Ag1]KKI18712.1 hypothetical protein XM48_10545 [Leucobacter sp. Ag1]
MTAYTPRGYTARLMVGIAERISAAGLAVYDPEMKPYPAGVRGVYFDHSPTGPGAEAVSTCVITPYMPQPGVLDVERTRIQVRARHAGLGPLEVRDWLDDLRALFPDKTAMVLGGIQLDRVRQIGSTTWGEPSKTGALESTWNLECRGNRYS